MALVDYSDSDTSDAEQNPVVKPASTTKEKAIQKVVDRANPGKIRVALPQASTKEPRNVEPPPKRVKTGGSGFDSFNSFLPPPRRTAQVSTNSLQSDYPTNSGDTAGAFTFKTGAAPGFCRKPELSHEIDVPQNDNIDNIDNADLVPQAVSLILTRPKVESADVKIVGQPLLFKPLSVARKPVKKKKPVKPPGSVLIAADSSSNSAPATEQTKRQAISLFSVSSTPDDSTPSNTPYDGYKSIIYGATAEEAEDDAPTAIREELGHEDYRKTTQYSNFPLNSPQVGAQSLKDIASDLNLSAAERRQLFGRQKAGENGLPATTKVINFNTDEEYKHNEELRAAGEQVVHKAVRSIAPGKHSLKQLVNAAASQKEALEEAFAKGKGNRAEASSRYGW